MRKKDAKRILALIKAADKISTKLDKILTEMENLGTSNFTDDLGWTVSHLEQAISEGMGHHISDLEYTLKRKGAL